MKWLKVFNLFAQNQYIYVAGIVFYKYGAPSNWLLLLLLLLSFLSNLGISGMTQCSLAVKTQFGKFVISMMTI